MTPRMGPERLPTDFNSAPPGRFATVRKRLEERDAHMPTDAEAKPGNLISRGIFVPDQQK